MLYVIYLVGGVLIGIACGIFISAVGMVNMIFGTLKTAYDDGEPYLFLDMDKHPEEILKHKFVVFRVDQKPISHD